VYFTGCKLARPGRAVTSNEDGRDRLSCCSQYFISFTSVFILALHHSSSTTPIEQR